MSETFTEATIILIGAILVPESGTDDPCAVLLNPNETHYEVPSQFRPLLNFAGTPRTEAELADWLETNEYEDTVDLLVESGKFLKITPATPAKVLDQFAGLRLYSQCEIMDWPADEPPVDEVVFVGRRGLEHLALPVSIFLATAMWHSDPGEDLPTKLANVADHTDYTLDELAAEALEWLPGLLASGYGYLGPVDSAPAG